MSDSSSPVRHVLASLALSPRALAVAREAVAVAERFDARLTFVHVGSGSSVPDRVREVVRAVAGSPEPSCMIRDGAPADVICQTAREVGADLILAGALEREGLWEGLKGSVARRIVRQSRCSVMLLTEPKPGGTDFRRVVVSLGDADNEALVRYAQRFARRVGGRFIEFVRELDPVAYQVVSPNADERMFRAAAEERVRLEPLLSDPEMEGLDFDVVCLVGRHGIETADHARRNDADLLIVPIPARPLTFWDRFFRQWAENVLENLPCAVLMVRESPDAGSASAGHGGEEASP